MPLGMMFTQLSYLKEKMNFYARARDWGRSFACGQRQLMLQLFTKQYGLEQQQVPEHVNLKPISSLGFLYIFNSDWFSCKYCLHCAWLFTGTARPFCNRLFRIMGVSYAIDFFIPGSSFLMNGKYFSYDSRIQSFQKFQLSGTRSERQQDQSVVGFPLIPDFPSSPSTRDI
ncbi:hypothetical protein NC652_020476 [Populus alba x Populus x berolinensis]|nr:hypothetical protein NC652_020476 [Populus alba x Populus x berolinensis]